MGLHLDQIKDAKLRRRILEEDAKTPRNSRKTPLDAHGLSQDASEGSGATFIPPSTSKRPISQKRIRQSTKGPNKWEAEYMVKLKDLYPSSVFRSQSLTFKLANGVSYTPDINSLTMDRPTMWEVKGYFRDDAIVKIKVAAHEWPEIRWILCWKEDGQWKEQEVLP